MEDKYCFSSATSPVTDRQKSALVLLNKRCLCVPYNCDLRSTTNNTTQSAQPSNRTLRQLAVPPSTANGEQTRVRSHHSVHHSASVPKGRIKVFNMRIQGDTSFIAFKRAFVKAQHLCKIHFVQRPTAKLSAVSIAS